MSEATSTYTENYDNLERVAAALREGSVDIDQLIPMVESAVASFKVCKERIKQVQEMLGQTLAGELQGE